jgi:hypothetical protein
MNQATQQTLAMSIRTDRDTAAPVMQPAVAGMPAIPAAAPDGAAARDALATIGAAQAADGALSDANEFNTNSPDHPLTRNIVIGIRASLDALCLQKTKGTWAPTPEALKAILQQAKFTDLSGTSERSGDLKSIVLHSIQMQDVKSTFPIALGLNATGVDNKAYSITGESFGAVVLPQSQGSQTKTLQEDDVSLGERALTRIIVTTQTTGHV